MSKAIGGGGGSSDLVLIAVLIVGAMMYTRSKGALAANVPGRTVYAPASAPASNGYGVAQVATGIIGGLSNWFSSGSTSMPDTYNGTDTTLNSFGTYGPIGGSIEDPWFG